MRARSYLRGLLNRLNVKLALGLIVGLFVVGTPFFAAFYYVHRNQLLEGLKSSTSSLSRLVVSSLESAMLQRTPHILQDEVVRLSKQSGVERIMILDKVGQVRVSSDPRTLGGRFDREHDPTCVVCHRLDAPERQSTTIVEGPSGEVFRNMTLIQNGPRCLPCHPASDPINGILVMDLSMEPIRTRLAASMRQMVLMAGIMVVLTIGVLWLLMKNLILKRLRRFMEVTERVRQGHLEESVPVDSGDEMGRLAESFNVMTGSLKRSFEELGQQRAFLENVINSIRDEIIVFDRRGGVVTANQAAREHSLRQADQVQSPLAVQTFQTKQPGKWLEVTTNPDGEEHHFEVHTYPLWGDREDVMQVIQVTRDLTERKYLEAHLRHSERLASLGLLASGFSHEINNPLASISAGVDGILRKIDGQRVRSKELRELKEYLHLIRDEIQRAKSITSRLLVLSRTSGGPPSLIDVRHVVGETLDLLRYRATQAGIEMIDCSSEEPAFVKGDEPALRQVLLNLLLNAFQATAEGGQIRMAVRPSNGDVEISVADSGCGIAPKDLAKIFEPFFSRRRGELGSGLGLFIVSSIVNQMGGRIDVKSDPGRGTEFSVVLPSASGALE